MHSTARDLGSLYFQTHGRHARRILDIGSMDLNGSLRPCAPASAEFVGVDIAEGPGVDIVIKPGGKLPFDACTFDAIISTSAFEHDDAFWATFLEMCRVVTDDGTIYINAPSNGHYHAHPLDCWRFYPDAGLALARWARKNLFPIELLESFVARQDGGLWNDAVMVFGRAISCVPTRFISTMRPADNVRRYGLPEMIHPVEPTEDQQRVHYLARNARTLLSRWLSEGVDNPKLVADTTKFLGSFNVNR